MLRSMADPFELNAVFLSVPTREKAKEQSPPALLFCIRINHFPLLCPERSGGHFKSFLLGSVELCLDLCRGCRGLLVGFVIIEDTFEIASGGIP